MKRCMVLTVMLSIATMAAWATSYAQDKEEEKSIKDVMNVAMKGGLCKKVADGAATDEEKKQLAELLETLPKRSPPKGEADSWKEKSTALAKAAREVANGRPEGTENLKKAMNCAVCHKSHKGA